MNGLLKAGAASVMLIALAGCATNSDLKALEGEVQKANAAASQAAADAASAKRDAAAAKTAAEEARDAARDTNEKLDRAFKKSMQK